MRMFLRPRWLLAHVVVLGLVATFISLGFWQLRRLDERRADNARITANMGSEPRPLADTLAEHGNDPAALIYRRVIVEGEFRPSDEVLLTPRSNGRTAGHHVLTPLLTADGQGVLIDRGWVPFADDRPPIEDAPPPEGQVTVTGVLLPTVEAARYGAVDGGDTLTYLSSADVDLVQPQVDVALQPFSILLQAQEPGGGDLPVPGAPPAVSEGSHESYAWQWFSFTAILLIGYPLLMRRSLSGRDDASAQDEG